MHHGDPETIRGMASLCDRCASAIAGVGRQLAAAVASAPMRGGGCDVANGEARTFVDRTAAAAAELTGLAAWLRGEAVRVEQANARPAPMVTRSR